MGFSFKSIGDIANAVSATKDLVSDGSEIMSSFKNKKDSEETPQVKQEKIYPERIEKLISVAMADGELDSDGIEMLERAAKKEGLDPDEVVFVAKKRLKQNAKAAPVMLSPVQKLAASLSEVDSKFDSAISAIRMGDSSSAMGIIDALTGGATGLAVSIGKSLFGKSDDDKINELEDLRDTQKARMIAGTTLPNDEAHLLELLEYAMAQVKSGIGHNEERNAWNTLHHNSYNRATMVFQNNPQKMQYLENLKPRNKFLGFLINSFNSFFR